MRDEHGNVLYYSNRDVRGLEFDYFMDAFRLGNLQLIAYALLSLLNPNFGALLRVQGTYV